MVYLISLLLQVQQPQNQALLYVDVCHSGNRPAAAPPVEPEKVGYADVNSKATDKITEDCLCTKHTGKVSSNINKGVVSIVCVHPPMMHGDSQNGICTANFPRLSLEIHVHCRLDLWCYLFGVCLLLYMCLS